MREHDDSAETALGVPGQPGIPLAEDWPMMTDVLGWCSSIILLMTIGRQVWKQWRTGLGEGVSQWLYIGQIAASAGFTLYSALVGNWVFIVTNALLLLSAMAGLYILLFRCRRDGDAAEDARAGRAPAGRAPAGRVAGRVSAGRAAPG
jgi:MtN3 and saliva related transmembrane protein